MGKSIIKSKRFWSGIIGIITGVSLIFTGEKSLQDPQFMGEMFITTMSFVQMLIGVTSNETITFGGKRLN